jgi:hypothetical protein
MYNNHIKADDQYDSKSDPRSWSYQRHYYRPEIKWGKIIANILFFLILVIGINFYLSGIIGLWISIFISISYILPNSKKILICFVQIYQRFAPLSLRRMCRFEPSCSQYMILSLRKFGALHGFYKGMKRIIRCANGEGGYDFP